MTKPTKATKADQTPAAGPTGESAAGQTSKSAVPASPDPKDQEILAQNRAERADAGQDDDLSVNDASQLQFPAKAGFEGVEIAERSADVDEETATRHEKVFVVQANPLDEGFEADQDLHARNIDAMRQAAILQGLRPTEDGEFIGAEPHPDGQSVCLRYAVAVVPVSVATPEQQVVAVTVEQQHELDKMTFGNED